MLPADYRIRLVEPADHRAIIEICELVYPTETPYTLARIKLAEGPILLTHLEGIDEPRCDQPVHLAWRALPGGRHLPVFRSADDGL